MYTAFLPYQSLFVSYHESTKPCDMTVLQYHDTYELYCQISGCRVLILNGQSYTLHPGDMYLLHPFELHSTQSYHVPDYSRYVAYFHSFDLNEHIDEDELNMLFARLPTGIYRPNENRQNLIFSLFARLFEIQSAEGLFRKSQKNAYLFNILLEMLECHHVIATDLYFPLDTTTEIHPAVLTALDYIHRNYRGELTLEKVADHVHVSKYHFCHLFSKCTGVTFLQYVNNMRLTKVHQLLAQTDLSLEEIAAQTGFPNAVSLSRTFSSSYHISPREFRKKQKEQEQASK